MSTQAPRALTPTGSGGAEGALRSVGRGASLLLVSTVILLFATFFTRVLITRAVSVAQWGTFSLGVALTGLVSLVAAFGIPTAAARALAFEQTAEARRALLRRATGVALPLAVVSSAFTFLAAPLLAGLFNDPPLTGLLELFAVAVGLSMLSNVFAGYFQGLERAGPNAGFNQALNPILFLAFAGALVFLGWGFTGAVVAYVLSWVGSFAALAVYTWRRLPPLIERSSAEAFSGDEAARVSFWELSATLFGVNSLLYLTSYADTLILGGFRPVAAVGEYSAAMTLARLFFVGAGTVTFLYLPITARLRRDRDFSALRITYLTSTRWMSFVAIPLFLVFFFEAGSTLNLTFGPDYTAAAGTLQLLAVSSLVATLLGPSPASLGGLGGSRAVLRYTAIAAGINLGLSFVLIPPFGILGAALAWSAARIAFPALCGLHIWLDHRIGPVDRGYLLPVAGVLLVLSPLFAWLLPHRIGWLLFAVFVFALAAYLLAILAFKAVEPGDLMILSSVEQRLGRRFPKLRRLLERRMVQPHPTPPEVTG